MPATGKWRALAVSASLLVTAAGWAQGGLPATATTEVSPSQLPSANPPVIGEAAGHSVISWDGHQLRVEAANAGMNGILREIAAKANLSLIGAVPEEPVFGTYGPGTLDEVLSALLDGVPVNMLLVDRSGTQRKELILTSRVSGVISPDGRRQPFAGPSQAAAQPETQGVRPEPPNIPSGNGFQGNAAASGAPGSPASANATPAATPAPTPAATTGTDQPVSPNGVKTPQQIFEQLQRLRQQGRGSAPQ